MKKIKKGKLSRSWRNILFGYEEGEPRYMFVARLKNDSAMAKEGKIYVMEEINGIYKGVKISGDRLRKVMVDKNLCNRDYLFLAKTTEGIGNLPKGSVFYVEKVLKEYYKGEWSGMCGSMTIAIPKDKCVKLDELK